MCVGRGVRDNIFKFQRYLYNNIKAHLDDRGKICCTFHTSTAGISTSSFLLHHPSPSPQLSNRRQRATTEFLNETSALPCDTSHAPVSPSQSSSSVVVSTSYRFACTNEIFKCILLYTFYRLISFLLYFSDTKSHIHNIRTKYYTEYGARRSGSLVAGESFRPPSPPSYNTPQRRRGKYRRRPRDKDEQEIRN